MGEILVHEDGYYRYVIFLMIIGAASHVSSVQLDQFCLHAIISRLRLDKKILIPIALCASLHTKSIFTLSFFVFIAYLL